MEHRTCNTIKRLFVLLSAFFAVTIISTGCYYDNEEELYPVSSLCDTLNITYSGTVKTIIESNCLPCHAGDSPEGNIRLDNYQDVATSAGIPQGAYGSLIGTISHAPGNSPMPKNQNKLSDCNIEQIRIWIAQGAQNN